MVFFKMPVLIDINAFGAKWKHPKESGFCFLAA